MDLPRYIRHLGVAEFCKRYGVTKRAADTYIYRQRFPRKELTAQLIADGLTWGEVYGFPTVGDRPANVEKVA